MFKDIIRHLENELNIKILNNGWEVEVIKSPEGEIETREVKKGQNYYYSDVYWSESEFIPVEEYVGSEDISIDQKLLHLMNWKDKQKMKEGY